MKRDFKLLKLPIGENHIQNRIDNFATELFPKLTPEQLHIVLDAAYDYLMVMAETQEALEEDSTFALNALARVAEAQFWIYQMQD
jgi:hypothetical protein